MDENGNGSDLFIYVKVYLLLFIELFVSAHYYSHTPFLFRRFGSE